MMKNNPYQNAIDYLVNKPSVKEQKHACFSPYFIKEYQKLVNEHNRRNPKR